VRQIRRLYTDVSWTNRAQLWALVPVGGTETSDAAAILDLDCCDCIVIGQYYETCRTQGLEWNFHNFYYLATAVCSAELPTGANPRKIAWLWWNAMNATLFCSCSKIFGFVAVTSRAAGGNCSLPANGWSNVWEVVPTDPERVGPHMASRSQLIIEKVLSVCIHSFLCSFITTVITKHCLHDRLTDSQLFEKCLFLEFRGSLPCLQKPENIVLNQLTNSRPYLGFP
jgi:hypothetical protein